MKSFTKVSPLIVFFKHTIYVIIIGINVLSYLTLGLQRALSVVHLHKSTDKIPLLIIRRYSITLIGYSKAANLDT